MSGFPGINACEDAFFQSLPKLPRAAEMALWDRAAIDFGLPETMLMENAGRAVCDAAVEKYGSWRSRSVWLFMGGGNNGGDAAAIARHIQDGGGRAVIFSIKDAASLGPSPSFHLDLARKNGVCFHHINSGLQNLAGLLALAPSPPDMLIDALLGTGFQGTLKAPMLDLIRSLNQISDQLQRPLLAVDIPSGLNADTGLPCPEAIRASLTVTLAAPKPGLLLPSARVYTGLLLCRSIGIPQALNGACRSDWRLLNGASLPYMPSFPANAYKNTFGHVLVLGGAQGYAGAASLASAAALRSGAGLVTACAPTACLDAVKGSWPEIMTLAAGPGRDWPREPDEHLLSAIDAAGALAIGPGMGRQEAALDLVQALLSMPGRPPAVVDADALALLGIHKIPLRSLLDERDIITPHPGEAAMLLQCSAREVQADRQNALDALCKSTGAAVVLKGAGTMIGQGNSLRLLCPYGIPQLAVGGAGDVLTGCAGACLASRAPLASSTLGKAGLAVLLHAMAALSLAEKYPDRGFLASELACALAHAPQWVHAKREPMQGILPWPC